MIQSVSTVSVDTTATVTVTALDQYGNLVSAENRQIVLQVFGASVTGGGTFSLTAGVLTRSVHSTTPGAVNLSLSDATSSWQGVILLSTATFNFVSGLKFSTPKS